ncbi:MAG: hypothetical protein AABW84_01585 [Nanoarchaeota archaeon]
MARYRRPSIGAEARHENRQEREKQLEGDQVYTRFIRDVAVATKKSHKIYERELIEERRATIIDLHKKGIPVATIIQETSLSISTVNSVLARYMLSQKPENLIGGLIKLPEYQNKPLRSGNYPKQLFNNKAIYAQLRDTISWTKQQIDSYLENNAEYLNEQRSNSIRNELQKRIDITNQDLEEIAQIVGTHKEIVGLEYNLLSGERNSNNLSILAERYGLTKEQMYALNNSFKAPENQTKIGINFMRIGMTLEERFGKIPALDFMNVAKIYRTEYLNEH